MPPEAWDDEIRTNLYGPFYCSQHFIRAQRRAGGKGKLFNITSVHKSSRGPFPPAMTVPRGRCVC